MVRRLVLATAVVLMCAVPARAAIITLGGLPVNDQGQFSLVPGATTVDFNALSLGTQSFSAGIATYQDATIFNCACTGSGDLLDDTTNGARAQDTSVPLVIDFSQPINYFGFYWGSPDTQNAVLLLNGATPVLAFTGVSLIGMGVPGGLSSAAYVNFTAGAGESFTRVVLISNLFPFETDNHAFTPVTPVPEPTSLLLLGSGIGAVLARARRRHKP